MENQAPMVILVNQDCPAIIHQYLWMRKANAAGAHQELQVPQEHPDHKVHPVPKVILVYPANLVNPVHKVHPARQAQLVRRAPMVNPVRREMSAKTQKVVPKDHLAQEANSETLDHPVPVETKAQMANPAHLDLQVLQDHPAKVANQATKAQLVHPDLQAHPAQTPTIALARNDRKQQQPKPRHTRKHNHLDRIGIRSLTAAFDDKILHLMLNSMQFLLIFSIQQSS